MNTFFNELEFKKPKFILSVALVLATNLLLAHKSNQNLSNTKVTFSVEGVTLLEIFESLEQQTDYRFTYDSNVSEDKTIYTFEYGETYLKNVLDILRKQADLKFHIVSKSISVTKNTFVIQHKEVKGLVTNGSGLPLPGASIVEKGTLNGTETDFDGKFALEVNSGNAILIVSYLGFKTQEVSLSGRTDFTITLIEDAAALDEIVVVGYGTQLQTNVSGSIAKAPMKELQDFPTSNYDQALAGKIAGVQVLQTTGEPGRELDIRVRGTGSITAGVEPLYVVDGVPLESSGRATEVVNMEDIESIQVLKDASSAAIYGSRGGNGVVLISTKKGKQGKMKVNFNHSYGIQELSKKIDMMDAYEYAQLSKGGHDAAYLQEVPTGSPDDPNSVRPVGYHKIPEELLPYIAGVEGLTNTDWQDEIYRRAEIKRYNISASGGTEKLNYFVSANHSAQEGIILNSDYEKTGLRTNLNINSGKFKIGLNVSPSYTKENRVTANNPWWNDGIVQAALAYSPTWPVYNPDGSFNYQGNGFWRIGTDYQHNEIVNPVALALLTKNEIEHYNLLTNLFVEYELLEGLKYKSSFAVSYNKYQNEFYRPAELETRGRNNSGNLSNPSARLSSTNIYNWIFENTINYNKSFGNHNFDLLGGITAQKNSSKLQRIKSSVTSDTPVNNAIQVINADQLTDSDGELQEWSLYSLLARLQYNYDNKYLLSASFRADASSRFGANNKWGYFPSVSAGWRVSQEDFMENVDWVSELKLRASFGLTGNFQIGNYEQISAINNDNYITGSGQQNGLRPTQIANPDLSWESTEMFNAGIDIELFKRQLALTFEYYNGDTSDLLLDVPVPLTTGFGTSLQNIGKVNNSGFEASVRISPDLGDFNWSSNFNISVNRNVVKELGPENADIITSAGTGHAFFITRVGESIGSYYLLVQDGIFSTQEELNQYPHFDNTEVGDFRFVDVDGDGVLDVNKDRAIVGNYAPDFTYGFSNTFDYKGFDLGIAFQGSYGGEILNLSKRYVANGEGNFNNTRELLNRWQSEANPGDGNTNRANRKARGNNGRTSTWHVEDGSYLRLQNLSLGYSLPNLVLEKLNLSKLRIYVVGNNLYTWTDYTGYNPEVNLNSGSDQLTPGLDYGVYPLSKTYSLGVNVSF